MNKTQWANRSTPYLVLSWLTDAAYQAQDHDKAPYMDLATALSNIYQALHGQEQQYAKHMEHAIHHVMEWAN